MASYKFKRNESFYIRDGWFQKAIHAINDNQDVNIFAANNGVKYLGIGTNMVKGLRYWLTVSGMIASNNASTKLEPFGNYILKYDPYLEDTFTWFLIHYFIVTKKYDAPIFNKVFNLKIDRFKKNQMSEVLHKIFQDEDLSDINDSYIAEDLNVFLKTYTVEDKDGNPEDNYICPLTSLELIEKRKDEYYMRKPKYSSLSYLIVYYSLRKMSRSNQFNIEDVQYENDNPISIFNLDKNVFLQYLDEMKKHGLINIIKTAGLNTVYFLKEYELEEIFALHFER